MVPSTGNHATDTLGKLPEPPAVGNQTKWNTAKLVIRSIALALEVVSVCLAFVLVAGERSMDGVLGTVPVVSWPLIGREISLTTVRQTGLGLIWDLSELIVICVRRDKSRGIKPGAHVGVDLVLCLGIIVSTGLTSWAAFASQSYWWYYQKQPYFSQWKYYLAVTTSLCGLIGVIV